VVKVSDLIAQHCGNNSQVPPSFRICLSLRIGAVEVFGGAEFNEQMLARRELEQLVVL
jgi:hypothetical protein